MLQLRKERGLLNYSHRGLFETPEGRRRYRLPVSDQRKRTSSETISTA